jgi:methionyl-tRNA synthetase
MSALVRHLARHCVLLFPFMPEKTKALWSALGAPEALEDQRFDALSAIDVGGWKVQKPAPLFPKEAPPAAKA